MEGWFETSDGHLDLWAAYGEIEFLYNSYGKEKDENLTEDAIELKKKIIDFVEKVKSL